MELLSSLAWSYLHETTPLVSFPLDRIPLVTLPVISERPITEKWISADTDNQPILPRLSANISARNYAKNWYTCPTFIVAFSATYPLENFYGNYLSFLLQNIIIFWYFLWFVLKNVQFLAKIRHFLVPILSAGWPILSADIIGQPCRYYRPIYRYRSCTTWLSVFETLHLSVCSILYFFWKNSATPCIAKSNSY